MKTTSKQEMPSVNDILAGNCPPSIYENMKIILSRTKTIEPFGELFIYVGRKSFAIVRLMDVDYVDGEVLLTVTNKETGESHVISHSLKDDLPMFRLVKLDDVLTLAKDV